MTNLTESSHNRQDSRNKKPIVGDPVLKKEHENPLNYKHTISHHTLGKNPISSIGLYVLGFVRKRATEQELKTILLHPPWKRFFDERQSPSIVFDSMIKSTETSVEKYLTYFTGSNFNHLMHKDNQTKLAGHLHSWMGKVPSKVPFYEEGANKSVNLEGFNIGLYGLSKLKTLGETAREIIQGKIDCQKEFGLSENDALKKIKAEFMCQLTKCISGFHANNIRAGLKNPIDRKIAIEQEVLNYSKSIENLKVGEKTVFGVGTRNHAVDIEFEKQTNGNFKLTIYNLGMGSEKHVQDKTGRIIPFCIENINSSKIYGEDLKIFLRNAIEDTIYSSLNLSIYNAQSILGGDLVKSSEKHNMRFQKRQDVGNCVIKSANSGMSNRLQSPTMYKYLKGREQSDALKQSGLDIGEISKLEHDALKHSIDQIAPGNMITRGKSFDNSVNNLLSKAAPGMLVLSKEKRIEILKENLIHFFEKRSGDDNPNFEDSKDRKLARAIEKFLARKVDIEEKLQIQLSPRMESYLKYLDKQQIERSLKLAIDDFFAAKK